MYYRFERAKFLFRVTNAANGQGRFGEESDFAQDCFNSVFSPVLVVFALMLSYRLQDLSAEYQKYGGEAVIGDAAWKHIEAGSEAAMATFVENYIRIPIS